MKTLFLIITIVCSITLSAQKPILTSSKLISAVVYFNGVELSHESNANLPAGRAELIIKNIANNINESTIQIGLPIGVTILSSQFSNDQSDDDLLFEKTPEIKKLRDSIEMIEKELSKNQTSRVTELKTLEILDANKVVAGQNNGLSVLELIKMIDYYKLKRTEVDNNLASLADKDKNLNKTIQRLNDRLENLRSQNVKTSTGKLILQLMCVQQGEVKVGIRYISPNALWNPTYDIKAQDINKPLELMYKAQIVQNTGLDWKKVKLSLSSGTPNQNNETPLLTAWHLRFGNVYYRNKTDYTLNSIPQTQSEAKISSSRDQESSITDYTQINENQLNVSFDIDLSYDILSNGKPHTVALKEIDIPCKFNYYSAPKAYAEAYLLAEIEDYSKYNLLKGEANIIFDDLYVGKTNIDPNQITEVMNINMGRDKKIGIKREKVVDKSGTKFLSSFKQQTFTYEISIRNNKKDRVELILKDQYPLSTDKEIEIELLQSDNASINSDTGILTWNLELAPNETKKIRISYSVKYPKDKIIGNL